MSDVCVGARRRGRRFKLHPPTLEFARHYGFMGQPFAAGDAKPKAMPSSVPPAARGFLGPTAPEPPTSIDQLDERAVR